MSFQGECGGVGGPGDLQEFRHRCQEKIFRTPLERVRGMGIFKGGPEPSILDDICLGNVISKYFSKLRFGIS